MKAKAALVDLAEVFERLSRGGAIEARDRGLLLDIVGDILGEADPRERFYEGLPGAPDAARHHVFVALDVHQQEDFATAPKKAIGRVARAWGLSDETVRAIERHYRTVCAAGIPAGIRNIVEVQRNRWLRRDDTKPPTRGSR